MFAENLCTIWRRIKLIIFEISHFDKGAKLIEFRPKKNGQNMLQMDKKGQKAAPIPLKVPFILDLNELGSWDANFIALTRKYENEIEIPNFY